MAITAAGVPASAAQPIGEMTAVVRDVTGDLDGTTRDLAPMDEVHGLEVLATGDESAAQTTFIDSTVLTLGSRSRITLDRFVYDGDQSTADVTLNLVAGVFRFVSGSLGGGAYHVGSSISHIGIRGTVFALIVASDGTTTVYVEDGSVDFANLAGASVSVDPGLASTIDAAGGPPTPPAPPGRDALGTVSGMTTAVATTVSPALAVPAVTVASVAALAATAAEMAEDTDSASPGGQGK